jgi:hypothetical protein
MVVLSLETAVTEGKDIGAVHSFARHEPGKKKVQSGYRVVKHATGKAQDRGLF